jgi:AraC family transcriptional regulator, transcriptional activator of pobA
MAKRTSNDDMYDPRSGDQAIRLQSARLDLGAFQPPRTNYFVIYLIEAGSGSFWADASQFSFGPSSLVFFVPYQRIRFTSESVVTAQVVQFHANFLCVETFHSEVGCSGVLFNDPYGTPTVALPENAMLHATNLIERLHQEQTERALAHAEVMLAHLKILLILATRLKVATTSVACGTRADLRHPVLISLRELIEHNYQSLHSPTDYAELLHITPKTLGRVVREYLGTTPTELIRNRILIHAKWELLHTLKSVKEISRELGFNDELYFSRLFKKATGQSPTFFREFETEIRGGSNLSMLSSDAPILQSAKASDI